MKKMKKVLAMLLAMAMVLGMSMTTFAAGQQPVEADKAAAIVSNVEAGATVTAYRIVEPTYNEKGFTGYKLAKGVTLTDMLEPTSDEITGIAANKTLLATLTQETLNAPEGATGLTTYTAQLGAGYWVVIVEGSNIQEVYNPMLVGIYYSVEGSGDDNTLVNGVVDANTDWKLNSTPAYAKSEQPTIDKKIVDSDGNESGNDVAIGDTVNFMIDTQIPSYSKSYTEVMVKITDTMGKGLTLADPANLVVMVGGEKVESAEDTFTYTEAADKKSFEISFASVYALAHSGEKVIVTYDAVLGEDAGLNFDANDNTAKLEYTNDPSGSTNEIEDKTYTYTFGIDANLFGQSNEEWNKFTEELLKTGEIVKVELENGTIVEQPKRLSGAEFTLTKEDGKTYTTVSDENGYLSFTGLDAGTYTLQETKAPEGYTLNDVEIPVVIEASYNEDGTLNSYKITVDGKATSTYTATYDSTTKKVTNIDCTPEHENDWSDVSDTHEIKNTKLSALPSTGGIGTTIFTVGGCAIMIIAAGLYFASRRKASR